MTLATLRERRHRLRRTPANRRVALRLRAHVAARLRPLVGEVANEWWLVEGSGVGRPTGIFAKMEEESDE